MATEKFLDRPLDLQERATDLKHVLSSYHHQNPAKRVNHTCREVFWYSTQKDRALLQIDMKKLAEKLFGDKIF